MRRQLLMQSGMPKIINVYLSISGFCVILVLKAIIYSVTIPGFIKCSGLELKKLQTNQRTLINNILHLKIRPTIFQQPAR